jgi:hypothetical protein
MLKQDVDEAMKEMESSDKAASDGEAKEPKKRRRRQKKGKKKAADAEEASDDVDTAEPETKTVSTDKGACEITEEGQTDQSQKKRRNKKGAKQIKVDNSRLDESESMSMEKLSSDVGEVKAVATMEKRKWDGRKKRKKKKTAVEGVSASRLASYGL